MKDFSHKTRAENISKLQSEQFDLLIIGGGITGAGVARDAAQRGLKVGLVEAGDFAVGTSSRSSKLVHGGIRYLENFEFGLVFEALSERSKLFRIAPTLVHPLRFMIPIFKDSRVSLFKIGLGMMLYDLLALFRTPELHEKLNAKKTMARLPLLRQQDLKGSVVYSDAYMDDDRLVHETLRSANEAGAVCANYLKVSGARFDEKNKIQAVHVTDRLSQKKFSVLSAHVVSSAGPWTDLVAESLLTDWKKILRPTKGVHLTFSRDRLPLANAVVMGAQQSDRIVFAIPRHEMVIVGTTDTDWPGNPSDATVTEADVSYLLHIANEYFPSAHLTEADIISSYVGVRPLVKDQAGSEGKTSREHVIISDPRGLTFIAGGKYTTYRLMSEQIVDSVILSLGGQKKQNISHLKKCATSAPLNPYIEHTVLNEARLQARTDIEKKLVERYGAEAYIILQRFSGTENIWQIEAYQAIYSTMCLNLVDFFTRRVPLMLATPDHGRSVLTDVIQIFNRELGWSTEELESQKKALEDYISRELAWKNNLS